MQSENEQKDKAWEICRAKIESQFGFNPYKYRDTGQPSCTNGCESFGSDRAICQGTTGKYSARAGTVAGGIIRQLISRSRNRLAKLEEQKKAELEEIQLLESALKRLEEIE